MQNAMILAIHYLGTSPGGRNPYREWAKRYADTYFAYQERHNTLLIAMRDPSVSMDAFTRMNDEVRANALELKRLRIELQAHEVGRQISEPPYAPPEIRVTATPNAPPDQSAIQTGDGQGWIQSSDNKPAASEDVPSTE